jgi:hypothetical protein
MRTTMSSRPLNSEENCSVELIEVPLPGHHKALSKNSEIERRDSSMLVFVEQRNHGLRPGKEPYGNLDR